MRVDIDVDGLCDQCNEWVPTAELYDERADPHQRNPVEVCQNCLREIIARIDLAMAQTKAERSE